MEKESSNKRNISLPGCVAALLVILVVAASLSMSAVAMWEMSNLKQEIRHQEVVIRHLQASKTDSRSGMEEHQQEQAKLKETLQMLQSKVSKLCN